MRQISKTIATSLHKLQNETVDEFGTGPNAHRRFTTKSGEAYFNGMPISDRAVIAIEIPTGNYTIMDGCDKFNPLCLS